MEASGPHVPPTVEELESLIVRSFRSVLSASSGDILARGAEAMGGISARLGYGWCRLYAVQKPTGGLVTLCEWSDGTISASRDTQRAPPQIDSGRFPWLESAIVVHGHVQRDCESLPPAAEEERRLLVNRGVLSILAVAILGEGGVAGAGVFHAGGPRPPLSQALIDATSVACELLAFAIARRLAEDELRVSEARFRLLSDASSEAIVVHQDGIIRDANSAAVRLLGRLREEMIGQPVVGRFIPPEEYEIVRRAMAAGSPGPYLLHGIHRDGTRIPVEVEARQVEQGGRTLRMVVLRDLREHQRTERALREGEARLRSLLEIACDGVVVIRIRDGRIAEASPGFCRVFGLRSGDAVGRLGEDFIAPECLELVREQVRTNAKEPYEVMALRADGTRFPIEILGNNATSGEEEVRTTGVRDLSARRRTDDERRQVETRLQQAQKMESLGMLAGGIAHDFNNLLLGVLGNLELAQRDLPPGHAARTSVEHGRKAASRAAELTAQMLSYAGRGALERSPVDLSALVRDMAELLAVTLPKKTQLVVETEPDLPTVLGDAIQLRQVAMNLLTNAGEAIGDQIGRVGVETGFVEVDRAWLAGSVVGDDVAPGPFVYLRVVDNGRGMDQATLDRMFDPFFTTKFTGRGLGLAAVLGIVRSHGGALKVWSRPGRGTSIWVALPSTGEPALTSSDSLPTQEPPSRRAQILVVDDEDTVRSVVERVLLRDGHHVRVARDGDEGAHILEALGDEIDLVLLDLTMPGRSGEELWHWLRGRWRSLPVLFMSGYERPPFADGTRIDFLQKPFRLETLREKVGALLGMEPPSEG